jgi:hypothetical protein
MPFKLQDFHVGDTVKVACRCTMHRFEFKNDMGVVVALKPAEGALHYDTMFICLDRKRKDRKRSFPPRGVDIPSDECLALFSHRCNVEFITSEERIFLREPI